MGKLIDEQTAYDVLTDYYHHSTDTQHQALREALGRVESVDAVPVRHGRWECSDKYENAVCSVCGYDTGEAYGFGYGNGCYNFCPMCGADMRKDGE